MNQKGGVFLERGPDGKTLSTTHDPTTLVGFLSNSTLTPIAIGASGFIIKARLHNDRYTPYIELGFNGSREIQMDRRELLIKLCILNDRETKIDIETKKLTTVTMSDFVRENALQSEIYRRTNVCLDSIVPYIFHSTVFDKTSYLYPIFDTNPSTKESLFKYLEAFTNINIGLIAMATTLDDIDLHSFHEIKHNKLLQTNMNIDLNKLNCIGIETMIRLYILAGCKHGDWHYGNLLYSNKMSPYLPLEGKYKWFEESCCIIIDFGRGKELMPSEYDNNWKLFKQFLQTNRGNRSTRLIALMESIYNQGSSFEPDLDEYIRQGMVDRDFYGWIKSINEQIAETVFNLIVARINKKQILRRQIESMIHEIEISSVYVPSDTSKSGTIDPSSTSENKKTFIKILTASLKQDKIEEYLDKKKQALLEHQKKMHQPELIELQPQQQIMAQQYAYSVSDIVLFISEMSPIYGKITDISAGTNGNSYKIIAIDDSEHIIDDSQIVPGSRISQIIYNTYMSLLQEFLIPNISTILTMPNCTIANIVLFLTKTTEVMEKVRESGDNDLLFIYNWLIHIIITINNLPPANICEHAKNVILIDIYQYITTTHPFVQINYLQQQNVSGAFRTSGGKRIRKKTMKRHRKKQTKRKKRQIRTRNKDIIQEN